MREEQSKRHKNTEYPENENGKGNGRRVEGEEDTAESAQRHFQKAQSKDMEAYE
jgi:hypothetical protein